MKKILSFALCFAFLVSALLVFPAPAGAASDSGIFGKNMSWSFDEETGELTISGIGRIKSGDDLNWYFCVNPDSVKKITVSFGVTSVASSVFANYPNLEIISFPETLTAVSVGAVTDCPSLVGIEVDGKNPVYTSTGNCLIEKVGGKLLLGTNESVITDGVVKSIGYGAFERYEGIETVDIPASVTYIDPESFMFCRNISEISVDPENAVYRSEGNCIIERASGRIVLGCSASVIPDGVTAIGAHAFEGCDGLTEAIIPESVYEIGERAFSECISLEILTIPDNLETIGDSAFFECVSLVSVDIPDSVTLLGDMAFCGCEGLTYAKLPVDLQMIPVRIFESCISLAEVVFPEELECIGDYAFFGCESLADIGIPESVTEIGDFAFCMCMSVETLDLPNSLETIGQGAFEECVSLENLVLPESVMSIGQNAFAESEIQLTEYNGALYIGTEDDPYYALVEAAEQFTGELEIHPDTKIICDLAFEGNDDITSVDIPDGVKSIGFGAFEGCSGIERVVVPSSVRSFGEGVFAGCIGIKRIRIPVRILLIADDLFAGCSSIERVACTGSQEEFDEVAGLLGDNVAFDGANVVFGEPEPGDVNGDGSVNGKDFTLLKKVIAGAVELSDELIENADIDGDGHITAKDLNLLKKIMAGSY